MVSPKYSFYHYIYPISNLELLQLEGRGLTLFGLPSERNSDILLHGKESNSNSCEEAAEFGGTLFDFSKWEGSLSRGLGSSQEREKSSVKSKFVLLASICNGGGGKIDGENDEREAPLLGQISSLE